MRTILATLTLLGATLAALLGTGMPNATAAAQPYGGCDEAYRYSNSAGAQDCRDAGWTIRPRLVVGPHGVVHMSRLPHCRSEDSSGGTACSWNIGSRIDGNGIGLAYWLDRNDRTHYVWDRNPLRTGWHWANRNDRTARDLDRTCIVRNGTTVASGLVARCPSGN